MPSFQHPQLAVPPPLMMSEPGSFAHLTPDPTMAAIAQRTIAENDFSPDIVAALEALVQELFDGKVRLLQDDAPDQAEWATYLHPYLGCPWIEVPWFFAEVYFYRRFLEATQYFRAGAGQNLDPFHTQKHASLTTSLEKVRAVSTQINLLHQSQPDAGKEDIAWNTNLVALLHNALWGNQADLSLKPTVDLVFQSNTESEFEQTQKTHVLVDDTDRLLKWLTEVGSREGRSHRSRIDLIADNAGFELVCDLYLIDLLLTQPSLTVYLHLKAHPTFVSDATVADVHHTLDVLSNDEAVNVQNLAARLKNYLAIGQLQLLDDPYWVSPLPLWQLPQPLHHELSQSDLVIFKGDANYRRLLGDRHWSFTTRFEQLVRYFPSPLIALRTLKSEVVAGLQPEQIELLNQTAPTWLTNGEWGVMQFADLLNSALQ